VRFSLLTTEYTSPSSGVISYNNSSLMAWTFILEGNRIKNDLGETVYLIDWNKALGKPPLVQDSLGVNEQISTI